MTPPLQRRALLEELGSKGIRMTTQRRAVVEVIQDAKVHLDADSLLELARKRQPGLNRATVYRTIELLKKLRLVDELDLMHLEGEKHYYEVKTTRDHIHLACFRCGRIEEFSSSLFEQLKSEIAMQAGFSIRVTRLEVGGACRACATADAKPESAAGSAVAQARTQ
ncbi:MAG TPA: Fur family transcriptional regulator [Bryobacteraceae bacterium]|nr:Fur family transcriptional regulator [Bryobacteraceae bacterium]